MHRLFELKAIRVMVYDVDKTTEERVLRTEGELNYFFTRTVPIREVLLMLWGTVY